MNPPRLPRSTSPLVTGCPRPFVEHAPHLHEDSDFPHTRLPVPWISTDPVQASRDFLRFDDTALVVLHAAEYKLCGICGEALGTRKVFGHWPRAGSTTGPGMHPRCALLSYHYCPYLREGDKTSPTSPDSACFDMVDSDCCGLDLLSAGPYDATQYDEEKEDSSDKSLYDLTEVSLVADYQTLLLSELCALARTDPTGTIVAPFHEVQALARGKLSVSSKSSQPRPVSAASRVRSSHSARTFFLGFCAARPLRSIFSLRARGLAARRSQKLDG